MLASLVGVRKSYRRVAALRGLDLRVEPGQVHALLGPNGAGKTTAISILLGTRRADAGKVTLMGGDPRDARSRTQVGATPQDEGFPGGLTVTEIARFVRACFPDGEPPETTLDRLDLTALAGRQAGGLSGGERRRLAVALAFVGKPRLAVLDEPTTGLDVEARRRVWDGIRQYVGEGGSVLLTTHYLEEAEALASQVTILRDGSVVASGTLQEIKSAVQGSEVRFRAPGVRELPRLPATDRVIKENGYFVVSTTDSDRLIRFLMSSGIPVEGLEIRRASLEEAFLQVVRGGQ